MKLVLLLWLLQYAFSQQLSFPLSFTVVRNVELPLTTELFLNRTGCCSTDVFNYSTSYNLISLDGFSSMTNSISQLRPSPLSFWSSAYQTIQSNRLTEAGSNTSQVQTYLLQVYHRANSKLLFNALANEAPISDLRLSANKVAQNIVNVLQTTQLDGVSIEFQDYFAVADGTASDWLFTLISTIRQQAPSKIIVLIIPPVFLLRGLIGNSLINSYVDFFVLRYLDMSQADYNTTDSLFNTASVYKGSAFMELIKNEEVIIDLCRTLIAKPAMATPTQMRNSFIDALTLQSGFDKISDSIGWFGGYANLDLETDRTGQFQSTVLQNMRSDCLMNGNCFCGW